MSPRGKLERGGGEGAEEREQRRVEEEAEAAVIRESIRLEKERDYVDAVVKEVHPELLMKHIRLLSLPYHVHQPEEILMEAGLYP